MANHREIIKMVNFEVGLKPWHSPFDEPTTQFGCDFADDGSNFRFMRCLLHRESGPQVCFFFQIVCGSARKANFHVSDNLAANLLSDHCQPFKKYLDKLETCGTSGTSLQNHAWPYFTNQFGFCCETGKQDWTKIKMEDAAKL